MDNQKIRTLIQKTISSILNEGTTGYWPGYSSDDTADTLGELKKKTSKIQNDELKKLEKELLNMSVKKNSYLWDTEDARDFWQKNLWVNLVLTSLQDGFYIDRELLEKSLGYLKDIIKNPNLKAYVKESAPLFKDTMIVTFKELSELLKDKSDSIYEPGFLDRDNEKRQEINNKHNNKLD